MARVGTRVLGSKEDAVQHQPLARSTEREVEYLGRKTGGKGQTGGGGGTRPRIVIDPFDVTSVPNVKVCTVAYPP